MILYYLVRSGLWRAVDREKIRFFFGWSPRFHPSRERPPWRSLPWLRAMTSPAGARAVLAWLRYRIELFDGQAG